MKINKQLAIKAKQLDICEDWHKEILHTENKIALVKIYVKGIDFCLSNNYPGNDYIRKHFKGIMEPYGVHLDEALELLNERVLISLGSCTGTLTMDAYHVGEVYCKDNSDLQISANDNTFVMVDIFDNARLHVLASGSAKVCINRYGGLITTEKQEDAIIKIIEKHRKTY